MMIVIALTQVLGVGTVALIAQAVGRRDAGGRESRVQPVAVDRGAAGRDHAVAGYLFTDAYLGAVAADAATIDGRSQLPVLVPARHGAAVRAGRDELCVAWHGDRQAHDDRADGDGPAQRRARPGADRGLGYRPAAGRRRRRSREHDRDRGRRRAAAGLLRAAGEVCLRRSRAMGAAACDMEAHARARACPRAASSC